MMGLVPTFGIELYADRVVRLMEVARREITLIEGMILGGLAIASVLMILTALVRRSAVAAVSFSFLALVGLVCALLFGRLDFVPPSTQVLVLCLAACALLLFLTATIRVARENPAVGAIVLIGLATLLVVGAGTALGLIDGAPLMRLGVAGVFGLTILCIVVEFIRRDRASLVVAPGILAVMVSPALMSFVANGNSTGWLVPVLPIMVLAGGAFYAAIAAQFVSGHLAHGDVHHAAGPLGVAGMPAAATTTMMREIQEDQGPAQQRYEIPNPSRVEQLDDRGPIRAFDDDDDQHPAAAVPHQYAAVQMPPHVAPTEESFSTDIEPTRQPAPTPPADFAGADAVEPVSARWGGGPVTVAERGPVIADDEYVWDQLAAQEVKVGDGFAALMRLPEGVVASPEIVRDTVASGSLEDFDDQILGGQQPVTGRFNVDLATQDGGIVRLEGRRQVDHDGLLLRVEARAYEMSAPRAARPLAAAGPAPLTALRSDSGKPNQGSVVGAIARGEIEAHFQPIVRLSDGVTVGFEALARWRQLDGSVVEAKDFVGELIKAGQGIALAELVIGHAARELANWIAAEPNNGQFVSINIAAADLPNAELATVVAAAVKDHALPAGALVVELTEGRIQSSQAKALSAAKAVREAGASLAIDDFGVGYSTLSRLSKFRFDLIKTDHSLISDFSNKRARAFMKTLLATAKKQGSPVIAEGIETQEMADLLLEMGCDFGQGYLFGRAEPLGGAPETEPPHLAQHDDVAAQANSAVANLR